MPINILDEEELENFINATYQQLMLLVSKVYASVKRTAP